MIDVNMIIVNNIQKELTTKNISIIDLAYGINMPIETINKIMNGSKTINANDLHKIAEFLDVSLETLMKAQEFPTGTNAVNTFMGRAKSKEAQRGIEIADELSDMILFHTRVYENGKKMEKPWENN
mgnify:FL=1